MKFESELIKNITVSGKAACGATTLSRKLSEKIGWKLINGGELVREYAKSRNIPLEMTTEMPDKYHIDLDDFIKEKLKNSKNLIVESWLSGFNAKGLDKIFKIFITCSDDGVRIDRLVNRDKMTVEQAKYHLKTREEQNIKKWEKLYGKKDFWDSDNFNLIIDTYYKGPEETLQTVLEGIGYK